MEIDHGGMEQLIARFLQGKLTKDEEVRLDGWLKEAGNRELFERICDKERIMRHTLLLNRYDKEAGWRHFEEKVYPVRRSVGRRWLWAASFLLPLCVGVWLLMQGRNESAGLASSDPAILPAQIGAKMELPTGEVIQLTDDHLSSWNFRDGRLARDSNGVLVYYSDLDRVEELQYNQVTTPRGGEFKMALPDGTVVWMNAESGLRFPPVFAGDCRKVYARGELYFDVARDEERPFVVEVEGEYAVKVLGTEFNVRSYAGEASTTTLVKGKVAIERGGGQLLLRPGQQAVKEEGEIKIREVDTDQVVAWMKGYFSFDNARLEEIMMELGRWYNVRIVFEEESIREERFSVEMRRHENFEYVLKWIEHTGAVKISIKDHTVFVR